MKIRRVSKGGGGEGAGGGGEGGGRWRGGEGGRWRGHCILLSSKSSIDKRDLDGPVDGDQVLGPCVAGWCPL